MSRMNVKEETNSSQQGKIDVKITFDESMLQLRQTPFGTIIDMDECITTGDPGGPLLPSKILRIATPPLTTPNMVDAVTDADVSGKRISLYVDDLDESGTIERFQFR
jgi:hypothetical protein